jgi:hypothetical protein
MRGLTRASILFVKTLFTKGMDCRVKPGNDGLKLRRFLARPRQRSDARRGSQRLINHNCFNSINDDFAGAFARLWNLSAGS